MSPRTNKALQLTPNSGFQLSCGSILASTLGVSASFGGAVVRSGAPIR
jgi:hypothetical protein